MSNSGKDDGKEKNLIQLKKPAQLPCVHHW